MGDFRSAFEPARASEKHFQGLPKRVKFGDDVAVGQRHVPFEHAGARRLDHRYAPRCSRDARLVTFTSNINLIAIETYGISRVDAPCLKIRI